MSTLDYIPPPHDLEFLPCPPPLEKEGTWVLEIGPGKGEFFLHMAENEPQVHFVALEIKRGRFHSLARRIEKMELTNAFVVRGDARECLTRLFKPESLDRIYILFPDPWPKKRHAKHRLLKPRLIEILRYLLKERGEIFSATDAGFYGEQIVASFEEAGGFTCTEIESLFPTYFEKKWRDLGRSVQYWRFQKQSASFSKFSKFNQF